MFLEQLGKTIVNPFIERKEHLPCTEASAAVVKAVPRARSCVNLRIKLPQPLPQLGQVKGRGVRSAHQSRNVKHVLCAAVVRNISAKAVHAARYVLIGDLVKAGQFQDTGCIQNIR